MRAVKLILLVWLMAALVASIFGDVSVAAEASSSTASFLKVGVGARATGLGGAFTSVADDPSAVYWNAAGIGRMDKNQLQFSHYEWYQDLTVENLYFAVPRGRLSFGAGITYMSFGEFQSYDEDGNPGEELSMYNLAASLAVSYNLNETVSLGLTGKYIEESFDLVKGRAFAGDIGLMADFNDFRIGLAAVNLGTAMKYTAEREELPAAIRVGLSLKQFSHKALMTVESYVPFDGPITWHQGLEVNLAGQLFARGGLSYQPQDIPGAAAFGYNLGAGIVYGVGRFDYTFIPSGEYGSDAIHSVSVSLMW